MPLDLYVPPLYRKYYYHVRPLAALAVNISIYLQYYFNHRGRHEDSILTSSNGLVSLKQLSQTSLTARSAAVSLGHAGFATTDSIARRRTQALGGKEFQTIFLKKIRSFC